MMALRILLFLFLSGAWAQALAATDFFAGKQVPLEEVKVAQQRALTANKPLLVVLGADWCRDSVALANHFQQSPLAEQINSDFELVMADVGYLQKGVALTEAFGVPIYWGTPFVMVVDPRHSSLMNEADLVHWTNARSHSFDEYLSYFSAARFVLDEQPQTESLAEVYQQQIEQFATAHAERIKKGYARLSAELALSRQPGATPTAAFIEEWEALKALRMAVPAAMEEMKQQAREAQQNNNMTMVLEVPVLPALAWERSE